MSTNDQSLWYLENIDVTGIFCPQKIGGMNDAHAHRNFKKGTYIFLPEEEARHIYFLQEGKVKIGTYSDTGKEITKTILGPGEVI